MREAGRGQCGHPAQAAGWVVSPLHADSSRDGGRTASCQPKWAVERVVRCLETETGGYNVFPWSYVASGSPPARMQEGTNQPFLTRRP